MASSQRQREASKVYNEARSNGASKEEAKSAAKEYQNNIPWYSHTQGENCGNNDDGYNYSRPMNAQELGDEWDDYAWTADDF